LIQKLFMLNELDPKAAGARRLEGKVCIVTGAGQGIGRAAARRLGAEGGKIVVAERIGETAAETVKLLKQFGVDAIMNVVDVGTLGEAERLMKETVTVYGRIDVLVNVVGGTIWWQPFHQYSEEQIALELERSLFTTVWCCKAVLPIMIAQSCGSIVNLSSMITRGGLYRVPYAISKGGVDALTKTLAWENGRYGIRVNAVAPIGTSANDRVTSRLMIRPGVIAEPAKGSDAYYQETRGAVPRPLDRQGLPEEQAAAIAFLASDDASFITGQIIDCAGGA
jgi:dihydroxycyclohexadiene carboxylate dehydrogenase